MLRKILLFALTSALAAQLVRTLSRRPARRDVALDKQAVQAWEDEGGSLQPATAPTATDTALHSNASD